MSSCVKPKPIRVPSYCLHKPTGNAYVSMGGKMKYLGRYALKPDGQPDCPEYHRLIGEWLAAGRAAPAAPPTKAAPLTVAELLAKYWVHCEGYYRRPDGQPSGELAAVKSALRIVNKLFSDTAAAEFGPKRLKQVRDEMRALGWCRSNINRQVGRVKLAFRWGVSEELIPGSVDHALRSVPALRFNPQETRESEPVLPVDDAAIDAVLRLVTPTVAAMIKLQRLTGMRPGELVAMKMSDIEMITENGRERWTYRPSHHKTRHKGIKREIPLGPQARELLKPFLKPMILTAFLFTNEAGNGFDVPEYRRAIARACDRAFTLPADLAAAWKEVQTFWNKWVYDHDSKAPRHRDYPPELLAKRNKVEAFHAANRWHPHQLRHNAATTLRKKFGLEQARVVLGHSDVSMTSQYAEQDTEAARTIMEAVG